MGVKILGARVATCSQRVFATLHELGIEDYEAVEIKVMEGEHKSEAYLNKYQPFGVIPAMDDEGFILFESRAICRYLAKKYQKSEHELMPSDLKAYGLFEQGAYIESSNFDSAAGGLVHEKFFKTFRGLQTDENKVKEHVEKLAKVLDVYDRILAKQDYIGGNQFTLADIYHLPYGTLLVDKCGFGHLINDRPHVKAWWDRIYNRPSWQARASL
jgi:glutathione S-transferase